MTCTKQLFLTVDAQDNGFAFSLNLQNTWIVLLPTPVDFLSSASIIDGALPAGITVGLADFDNVFFYGSVGFGGVPTVLGTYDFTVRVTNPTQDIPYRITVQDTPLDSVTWDLAWPAPGVVGFDYVTASDIGSTSGVNFQTALAALTNASVTLTNVGTMARSGRSTSARTMNFILSGAVSGLGSGSISLTQYRDAGFVYGTPLATRSFANPPENANDSFEVAGGDSWLVLSYSAHMEQGPAVATPSNYEGTITLT